MEVTVSRTKVSEDKPTKMKKKKSAIIGSTVTTSILLLVGIIIGVFFWKSVEGRKKISKKEAEKIPEIPKEEKIPEIPEDGIIPEIPEEETEEKDVIILKPTKFADRVRNYLDDEDGITDEDFCKDFPPELLKEYEKKKEELSDENVYDPLQVKSFLRLYRNHLHFWNRVSFSHDQRLHQNLDALNNLVDLIPETLKVHKDRELKKEDFFEKTDSSDVTKDNYLLPQGYSFLVNQSYKLLLLQSDVFFQMSASNPDEGESIVKTSFVIMTIFRENADEIYKVLETEKEEREKRHKLEQKLGDEEIPKNVVMVNPHFENNQSRIQHDISALKELGGYYRKNFVDLQKAFTLGSPYSVTPSVVRDVHSIMLPTGYEYYVNKLENPQFLHPYIAKALLLFGKATQTYTDKSSKETG